VIEVRVDDLAFYDGEAIVRPVTADLVATTPLLRRLEAAAGDGLQAQLRKQETLAVGSAVVSSAGALGVELMVHAVVSSDDEPVSVQTVRRALTSALQRTVDWQIGAVAIAPFGLGAGNLAIEDSAAVLAEVLAEHVGRGARFPEVITVVAETNEEASVLSENLRQKGL
jgi:O-acetyl-ADP-ribose deacetylase (regulator of RNase III)